jgi:hypothetical protein
MSQRPEETPLLADASTYGTSVSAAAPGAMGTVQQPAASPSSAAPPQSRSRALSQRRREPQRSRSRTACSNITCGTELTNTMRSIGTLFRNPNALLPIRLATKARVAHGARRAQRRLRRRRAERVPMRRASKARCARARLARRRPRMLQRTRWRRARSRARPACRWRRRPRPCPAPSPSASLPADRHPSLPPQLRPTSTTACPCRPARWAHLVRPCKGRACARRLRLCLLPSPRRRRTCRSRGRATSFLDNPKLQEAREHLPYYVPILRWLVGRGQSAHGNGQ